MRSKRLAPSFEPLVSSAVEPRCVGSRSRIALEKGRNRASARPAAVAAALFSVFLATTPTEAHDNAMDGNPSNDWIEGLTDSAGNSCCGNNDCRPVVTGGLVSSPRGVLQVEIDGRRFQVPEGSIVPGTSPDGRAWVCPDLHSPFGGYTYAIRGVRCLLLPPVL